MVFSLLDVLVWSLTKKMTLLPVFQAQSYVQGLPAQKKKNFKEVFPSLDENGALNHFYLLTSNDMHYSNASCDPFDFISLLVFAQNVLYKGEASCSTPK